jgi:hypothetical protein
MHLIYVILIFCIVLFLYLHIYFQLKTSDDLEIYEIDYPSKDKLEEICNLRQPVLFDFNNERLLESCKRQTILDTYGAFDVKIRNIKESSDDNMYVPIAFSNALTVVNEDKEMKYIVENNGDFLEETGLAKSYKYNDAFLRPYMVSQCSYDFLMAGDGVRTHFKYELNFRNYILVTEGNIKVKLAPPKSKKYLNPINDYENLEFSSPINPWQVQAKYRADFDKVKCLDIILRKGQILFLPAYWWYSIAFGKETSICTFKYKTYMNTVAVLPQLVMKLLQTQNVKRNNVKQVAEKEQVEAVQTVVAAGANESVELAISVSEALLLPTDTIKNDLVIGTTLIDDLQQTTVL